MKSDKIIRFEDLSVKEKLALTDEEVEKFIDLECAFEGVKLIPCPEEPIKPEIEESEKYYQIGYSSDFRFKKRDEAEKVLELLRKCSLVGISYLGDYNYVREIERFDREINTCSAYSKVDIKENKEKLDEYVRLKKSYDELLSEYNESMNAREKIEKRIYGGFRRCKMILE